MSTSRLRDASPKAEINVTPMVDVMLVLLIIFMITAPVLSHRIDIDLPQGTPPDRVQQQPPPIDLRIAATGELYWNGQPIVSGALEPQLRLEAAHEFPSELRINADYATPYAVVAEVLATARRMKIERIGFKQLAG